MEKKRRNRVKQTTSLTFRLLKLAETARIRASSLPPGAERERMLSKSLEARRALEIEKFLATPGAALPS
ncbi:hypothetical protein [Bradyrhizobium sp. USDA 4454]